MGCAGLVKLFVFAANFLFALAAIALLTVGILYKLNVSQVTNAIPDSYGGLSLAPVLTIVIGAVIFVIACFGCCGAIKENSCLLTTYAVILLVILICQIALGVYEFLEVKNEKEFNTQVDRKLEIIFGRYHKDVTDKELVDLLQNQVLHCCGVNGSDYWTNPDNFKNHTIPESCYVDKDVHKELYKDSCQRLFKEFLHKTVNILGITALTIAAVEIAGCVLALCLANSIRNDHRRGVYY